MSGLPLSIRLLVIDDDDVDRERVLRLLARTPLAVEAKEADSGRSALRLLRDYEFDCIVLDNQLGDDSGAELLPTIQRASRRPCPVIMITGAGSETLAVRALQDGAADYLTKYQLSADLLLGAIRRALEHQRLRSELESLQLHLAQRVEQQAAAIRQSERDLRAILDHTPTVIGYWSADLRNRFGNRAYRRWLGIDPEALPGRALVDIIGPERLARDQEHIDAVLRGESRWFERTDVAPDGRTRRDAQISFHPDIADDGTVRGFYSTMNDVTEIKRAQARAEELAEFTETLFEHSPVGLGVFDARLQCVKGNRALSLLVGVRPPDPTARPGDVTGPQGWSIGELGVDESASLSQAARATLADGQPRRLDIDLLSPGGARILASCAWARVEHEGQEHLLLAAQDTTEQHRAHDALVAARDAAEAATRTKSTFLANMSHEIRTPMNAVIGLSRLALDGRLPEPAHGFVEKAHGAAVALMGLLDDVLDYSKVEAGQLRFEQVAMDLEQVLQRVVDLFAARIEQRGLAFVVDIAPDLPRRVVGDPLRLGQVLNNLVGNAVKFTDRGRIVLSVRALADGAPAEGLIRFAVRDTGIGIPEARQASLFEAFEQGDNSITRRFGGTGLGLTICRRLVTMMHGAIGVRSVPGEGSEFWFSARLAPAGPVHDRTRAGWLARQRVLLVEADEQAGAAMARAVDRWGAHCTRAGDLPEALQLLSQVSAPGLAFSAVLMSVDPGATVEPGAIVALRREAARWRPLLVLGTVSAMGRLPPGEAAGRQAPDHCLQRPVLPSALRSALVHARRGLRSRKAQQLVSDAGRSPARPLAGLHVLLVEDNSVNRLVARVSLERLGARVDEAEDGLMALQRLDETPPDRFHAVLMDLHMPGMDGLEATRRIRARPELAGLPVIGMTAATLPEDRQNCRDAGMAAHLSKPFLVEELVAVLLRSSAGRPGPVGVVR